MQLDIGSEPTLRLAQAGYPEYTTVTVQVYVNAIFTSSILLLQYKYKSMLSQYQKSMLSLPRVYYCYSTSIHQCYLYPEYTTVTVQVYINGIFTPSILLLQYKYTSMLSLPALLQLFLDVNNKNSPH